MPCGQTLYMQDLWTSSLAPISFQGAALTPSNLDILELPLVIKSTSFGAHSQGPCFFPHTNFLTVNHFY